MAQRLADRITSRARRGWAARANRGATVTFGPGCQAGPGFHLDLGRGATFTVGRGVVFRRRFTCEVAEHGRVTIGNDVVFTYDTIIQISTSLDIGDGCQIGRVLIADGNHRYRDLTRPITELGFDFRPIVIGDQTMVTTGAVVTNSVGRRCVIGANSVVTRPIPDYSVAVGAPARVVESYGPTEAPTP